MTAIDLATLTVKPLSTEIWSDYAALIERHNSVFPITEIDATYYALPAEQQARLWAERTPDGFRFDLKAYALLTGHPTRPQSLWKELRDGLSEEAQQNSSCMASRSGSRRSLCEPGLPRCRQLGSLDKTPASNERKQPDTPAEDRLSLLG